MTKHSDSSPLLVQHAWRDFPSRLKDLIKKNATVPPMTPPMSFIDPNKSLLNRLFSKGSNNKKGYNNNNSSNKCNNEWDRYTDVPLRAMNHHIPLLTQINHQQVHHNTKTIARTPTRAATISAMGNIKNNNSNNSNSNNSNSNHNSDLGYIYVATLTKLKNFNHYTLNQQLSLHRLIVFVQKIVSNGGNGLYNIKLFQRDCLSILSNSSALGIPSSDFILNRKPPQSKRTRYIFMLLSTPWSEVKDKIHPVTEAYKRLRKPYSETTTVILNEEEETNEEEGDTDLLNRSYSLSSGSTSRSSCSSEITISVESTEKKDSDDAKTFKFVPADFLLDPATLRTKSDTGSKLGSNKLNLQNGPLEPQFIFDNPILKKKKRTKSILSRFKLKNRIQEIKGHNDDNNYIL